MKKQVVSFILAAAIITVPRIQAQTHYPEEKVMVCPANKVHVRLSHEPSLSLGMVSLYIHCDGDADTGEKDGFEFYSRFEKSDDQIQTHNNRILELETIKIMMEIVKMAKTLKTNLIITYYAKPENEEFFVKELKSLGIE